MKRFLRLFSQYRWIEARLLELEAQVREAKTEISYHRGRADWAEARMQEARAEGARSLKMVSNWQSIQAGSPIVPYPDVHVEMRHPVDESPVSVPVAYQSSVRLARDVQRDRVAESRRKAAEAMARVRQEADTIGLGAV